MIKNHLVGNMPDRFGIEIEYDFRFSIEQLAAADFGNS